MSIIEFHNVSKQYEGEKGFAVRGVTFHVEEGEFLCLVGASGCGKSTVMKLIAGLERATSGTITKPERVAMTFQSGALLPWLSVYDNAALGLRQMGTEEATVRRIVEDELRQLQIHDLSKKFPSELSGGQRQRTGLARALAVNPHVLLLDEPFSALDPKTTAELHDDIIALWRRTKKTIVMVSHQIEEAVSLADRVLLMKDGTVANEFRIELPYPRRENDGFHHDVNKILKAFFV